LLITTSDSQRGFITKPTAADSCFINGDSHHPKYIFRAVIKGEATRLRRLNEYDKLNYKSLDILVLKQKCIDSNFKSNSIDITIEQAKSWCSSTGDKENICLYYCKFDGLL